MESKKLVEKFIWRDCLTFLTLKEVDDCIQSSKVITLNLVNHRKMTFAVSGRVISTRWLNENAFYFTFLFEFNGKKQGIKIKQNVRFADQRYVEEMDPEFLDRLMNH
jgi:hypothetical protein